MSTLVIDAGNTRIKWGVFADDVWALQGWVPTRDPLALNRAGVDWSGVEAVMGCNVAGPGVREAVESLLSERGLAPCWLTATGSACGVRNAYAEPGQLGTDRWAALIGAWNLYESPAIVVNAGTTMTVDILDEQGIFVGGCIVAGYELMRQSLAGNTAQLTLEEGRYSYFPDNTADAIASGAINALAGAVERMATHARQAATREPVIVLSGGDAARIESLLSGRVEVVDNLVLEGLRVVAAAG